MLNFIRDTLDVVYPSVRTHQDIKPCSTELGYPSGEFANKQNKMQPESKQSLNYDQLAFMFVFFSLGINRLSFDSHLIR